MNPELLDTVARVAANNLARDLASGRAQSALEVAEQYILEAYRSISFGGATYAQGQRDFTDTFMARTIQRHLEALEAESVSPAP